MSGLPFEVSLSFLLVLGSGENFASGAGVDDLDIFSNFLGDSFSNRCATWLSLCKDV